MGLFTAFKAALSGKPRAAGQAAADLAAAASALETAELRRCALEVRREAMLTANDEERERYRADLYAAEQDVADAQLLVARLQERSTAAEAAAAEAKWREADDLAVSACQAYEKQIAELYPKAGAIMRDLASQWAIVERLRQTANAARLLRDLPAIPEPEAAVRDLQSLPQRILDRREVEVWCLVGTAVQIPDDAKVQDTKDGRGVWHSPTGLRQVERRRFRVVRTQAFAPGMGHFRLLSAHFPGLRHGDPDFWRPTNPAPNDVENTARELAAPRPAARPSVIERWEPIDTNEAAEPTSTHWRDPVAVEKWI